MDLTVRIHDEDESGYWAEVVELPGCFASGRTLEETLDCLKEAIPPYLSKTPWRDLLVRLPVVV